MEQALRALRPAEAYYWATHGGAELDLLFTHRGHRYGLEFKFSEAPMATKSMHTAVAELRLKHLWIAYPGKEKLPIGPQLSAWPLQDIAKLRDALNRTT